MAMSITHRITGLGLAMGVYGFAFGALTMKGKHLVYFLKN